MTIINFTAYIGLLWNKWQLLWIELLLW